MRHKADIAHCLVCGCTAIASVMEGGEPHEICPCCGLQAGYEFSITSSEDRLQDLRKAWIFERKGQWWRPDEQPKDQSWSPESQLKAAGLSAPEQSELRI